MSASNQLYVKWNSGEEQSFDSVLSGLFRYIQQANGEESTTLIGAMILDGERIITLNDTRFTAPVGGLFLILVLISSNKSALTCI